ncbi:hypothetical protein [Loigolactobacillus jiayinensis]|uniref:Uncharacterized protein n=1 Tax=Loigolactobacillus jiayinensis TaxID=2486016 RepID=A0ABW1RA71_9LACO|nr:hypothetical protein [Loigolactobacillus jiayinensis]
MEEYDFVQTIYHADFAENNSNFIDNNVLLSSREDGNWCGRGMYFWDNLSNARYWQNKKKKHSNRDVTISQASLRCYGTEILDLTDDDSAKALYRAAVHYKSKIGFDVDLCKLGAVINFVHQALIDDQQKAFSVVKLAGVYGRNKEENLIESYERAYDKGRKSPHATSRLKIIYSVRHEGLLFSQCLYHS